MLNLIIWANFNRKVISRKDKDHLTYNKFIINKNRMVKT